MNLQRFILILSLSVFFLNDSADSLAIKRLKKVFKSLKKFLKKGDGEVHEETSPHLLYAIPNPDGPGYVLTGELDPYASKDKIDVYQLPKVWSGDISVPNFLTGLVTGNGYGKDNGHLIQGFDNRFGFKLSVPFFGDFQYVREMGPGRYTDKLGPGKFKYPGIKEKRTGYDKEHQHNHHKGQTPHGDPYQPHHALPTPNEITSGSPYLVESTDPHGQYSNIHDILQSGGPHGIKNLDYIGPYELSYLEPHAVHSSPPKGSYNIGKADTEEDLVMTDEATNVDPLASMRNYPWHRR